MNSIGGGYVIDYQNTYAEFWHFNDRKSLLVRFYRGERLAGIHQYDVSPELTDTQVKLFVEQKLIEKLH